jgi:hypothetical protein
MKLICYDIGQEFQVQIPLSKEQECETMKPVSKPPDNDPARSQFLLPKKLPQINVGKLVKELLNI